MAGSQPGLAIIVQLHIQRVTHSERIILDAADGSIIQTKFRTTMAAVSASRGALAASPNINEYKTSERKNQNNEPIHGIKSLLSSHSTGWTIPYPVDTTL